MMPKSDFIRRPDWPDRLNRYLAEAAKDTEIRWGDNDCCTFMAGGVIAMTDTDPIIDYRGKYKTANGALRALKRIGGGDLKQGLTKIFGEPVHPARARQGDVGLAPGDGMDACGLVCGKWTFFLGDDELPRFLTLPLTCVFRVGQ